MKLLNWTNPKSQTGYALIIVLVITGISILVLGSTMSRAHNTSRLNQRNNNFVMAQSAAEAATEKALALLQTDYMFDAQASVNQNLASYRTSVPDANDDPYWSAFEFSDAQGATAQTYIESVSNVDYVTLDSQYAGLKAFASTFRVVSNARYSGGGSTVVAAVQQQVQLAEIPIFQYAIFYNGLLEFTWAAPLTVRGRVHANGDIYTGSAWDLDLKEIVTATGTIQKRSWAGYSVSSMRGDITYHDGKSTNVNTLSLPVGTNNTQEAVREILNQPPLGEAVLSELGQQRFYNKAQMLVLVSNAAVTIKIKHPFESASVTVPADQTSTFLSLDKFMYDQRERKDVALTELDLEQFRQWSLTNSAIANKLGAGQPPNIVYVDDERTEAAKVETQTQWYRDHGKWYSYTVTVTNVVPVELAGVRLVNGQTLPTSGLSGVTHGLTVATPNPLYVKGHFNCPNGSCLGTTNTSDTEPSALLSDAITVLSANWEDDLGTANFNNRDAQNTTINAAILSGTVESDGQDGDTPFSGGAMNMTRLLEDWGNGSKTLTLNTSIVKLFNSVRATGAWQVPGTYYYAPTRNFNFDQNFRDPTKLPPGTPRVRAMFRNNWATPPPDTVNYAANTY